MAIVLSDNIQTNAPKPTDGRYYNNLVPYSSISAANTAIVSGIRYTGLTVNILGTEYWYCNGIGDSNLVVKTMSGQTTWNGSTANGIGTYIDAAHICSNPNLTFNGTTLNIIGNVYASSCIRGSLISGTTVCGSTSIASPKFIENGTCLASTYLPFTMTSDMQDPTGFINGNNIDVSYNLSNRTITLTGDLSYYWQGVKKTLSSPWTSSAHTTTDGAWYLYSNDGTNFIWSQTIWNFSNIMVAVAYTNGITIAIREVHGLMDWRAHEELHNTIGTYLKSGGQATAGSWTANTATDAAVSPSFNAAVVKDEDLITAISAWDKASGYSLMYVSGNTKSMITTGATRPFLAAGINDYIYYYPPATAAATKGADNRWYNVYQLLIPVTSDNHSQIFRMGFLLPQQEFTSLAAAQAEDTRGLSLGEILSRANAEYVIYSRITYATSSGNTNYGKVTIPTDGITYVVGSKFSTVSVAGVSASNHDNLSNLTWTSSGHLGTNNTLAGFDGSGAAIELAQSIFVTGATNLGSGNGTIYTSVSANKLKLKTLSGGTNVTLTCNGNYIAINASGGASTASGERVTKLICQTSHGFSVGNVLGWSGGTYNKAIALSTYDGEIVGIVSKCYNANCFDLTQAGYVTGLTSLSTNTTYFLSDTTAGLMTATRPTTIGHLVKSVLAANSTTSGWVLPYAAYQISVSTGSTAATISEYTITGNSSSTGFTINHAKNKQFVMVEIVKNSSPYPTVYTNVQRTNANCICITFDTAPATGQQYKILIIS